MTICTFSRDLLSLKFFSFFIHFKMTWRLFYFLFSPPKLSNDCNMRLCKGDSYSWNLHVFFSSSRPKENWHTNSLVKESWFKLKLRELITCLVTRCIYLMTILNWGNIVEYHFDVTYTFLTLFTFLNKINEGIE